MSRTGVKRPLLVEREVWKHTQRKTGTGRPGGAAGDTRSKAREAKPHCRPPGAGRSRAGPSPEPRGWGPEASRTGENTFLKQAIQGGAVCHGSPGRMQVPCAPEQRQDQACGAVTWARPGQSLQVLCGSCSGAKPTAGIAGRGLPLWSLQSLPLWGPMEDAPGNFSSRETCASLGQWKVYLLVCRLGLFPSRLAVGKQSWSCSHRWICCTHILRPMKIPKSVYITGIHIPVTWFKL